MAKLGDGRAHAVLADPRWAAVVARDPQADGQFFYSVSTTGVYCRPSCGARRPRPQNVDFFLTAADAEKAGFRPCKRCKPDQQPLAEQHAALVAQVCRVIEAADTPPSLAALAQSAGISAFHLHRLFKAQTGMTPKAYAAAQRARKVRAHLASGSSVTDAIYAAGYQSNSRFYAESNQLLGMAPKTYRAGAAHELIRFAVGTCSLGEILVAASARGLCAIFMGDDADLLVRQLQDCFPRAELTGGDAEFEQLVGKVLAFLEMPRRGLDLPLDLRGTVFQQLVWRALREVPAGHTLSYAELARRIGAPTAIRAVAGACAANVLAVAIPCHRVVRTDGSLSGYRWGVERKRALIERESGPGDEA
ncbi:MAG: bifunctional DNA-binding transcriptional regulator/O6-methylguanine-DNA methyltransferase Ada [Rhodocyclaceae bacterium]|nr:bifunctional DNA-binding transcriptional regulator/O6-methylguanine-DNA methyltransferase Ada [Rhodocyclaceae bacterium]